MFMNIKLLKRTKLDGISMSVKPIIYRYHRDIIQGSSRAFPHLLMLVAHYQSHLDILPMSLTSAPVPT